MGVSLEIDLDKVFDMLSQQRLDEAKHNVMSDMMADMTRFVPLRKGPLRESVHIDADKEHIVWRTPYARAQYYGGNGKVKFRNYTHPGTGPYWDKVASSNYMEEWSRALLRNMGF